MTEATSGQATTDAATAAPAAATSAPAAAPAAASAAAPAAPAASTETTAASATPAATTSTEPSTPTGAPEKYEFKPTEGIKFNDVVIGKFSEVAKELNLTQDGAQKVLTEVAPLIAKQQVEAFKATVEGWETASKADKEIGGEKYAENLALARKGIDAHFSADFIKLLNDTGLGNHPEMIRGMMKIGRTVSQDKFVPGGTGSQTPMGSAADKLYGSK